MHIEENTRLATSSTIVAVHCCPTLTCNGKREYADKREWDGWMNGAQQTIDSLIDCVGARSDEM